MLYKLLKSGYAEGKDLNCAEQILYGANEAYNLGLDKSALKMSAAFGGGMAIEDKCGALTGALMVLGRLLVEDRGHVSNIKPLSVELYSEFENRMKAIDCKPLKEMYRTEAEKCNVIILEAAKLLDEILAREMSLKVQ